MKSVEIIGEYAAQGYQLTLRQLYYQMVSRDIIPNQTEWYKKLGEVVSKGRMPGFIDWNAIVDRGRSPVMPAQWDSPSQILQAAADSFRVDRWAGQYHHVEVWCEKDAPSGVLEPVCNRYHVRFMANRGYSSSTAMYDAAKRIELAEAMGQAPVIIYLGDHDPSGLDMNRDVHDRLTTMTHGTEIEVHHLALTRGQVNTYNPPPNPTKLHDSRAPAYLKDHGNQSWELDALEPQVLDALLSGAIEQYLDPHQYDLMLIEEEAGKDLLLRLADQLDEDPDAAL